MSQALIGDDHPDTGFWNNDATKGLTRAAAALGVAFAYDFCKSSPVWSDSRSWVADQLKSHADSLMRSGGSGWPGGTGGNNWWAVRYSAAGLCYLATDSVDETLLDGRSLAREQVLLLAYQTLIAHFNDNLQRDPLARGWNAEGIGYTQYPWQFSGPFGIAMKRLTGRDLLSDGPPALKYALPAMFPGVVPLDRPGRGKGIHADYQDDGPNWDPQGSANLAFAYVSNRFDDAVIKYAPAMRYIYDRVCGDLGDRHYDSNRGGGLYGILYYPVDVAARDPSEIWGNAWIDRPYGMVIARNRYQDERDIVAQLSAKGYRAGHGHSGPDMNGFRLIGLGTVWATGAGRTGDPCGQSTVFPADPNALSRGATNGNRGVLVDADFGPDGSGYAITSSVNPKAGTATSSTGVYAHVRRLVVDYSGSGGVGALFVIADSSTHDPATGSGIGRYWRLNTPEFNDVRLGDRSGEFFLVGPTRQRLFGKVLWGDAASLRIGVGADAFRRDNPADPNSSGFGFGDTVYRHNHWVDFRSEDGQFVVLLALLPAGTQPPSDISSEGTGANRTIRVGSITIRIDGNRISRSSTASPGS
jgi:hypothetical protein